MGLVLTVFSIPALRNLLQLAVLPASAWLLIGSSAVGAVVLNYVLSEAGSRHERSATLPSP